MAVQSDTSRIQYAGNNSTTTSYAVPFVFQENSHLKAIARTSAGVESVVTLTNHSGAGNVNGGTVRTAVAVPATSTLTIYREVPATQTTTYAEGGDFPAASHERALDKLTQIAQQLDRKVGSAIRLSAATQLPDLNPPLTNQQHILSSVGGAAPSWQALPSLSIGPVIATGSTTARSAQDRAADVANVKDFGAVGDGVTSDTAAFNAAIANSGGVPVLVPKANYNASVADFSLSGAISFADGASKQTWLLSRKMTGNLSIGAGPLIGWSPAAYMQDLTEDVNLTGALAQQEFMVASRVRHRFLGGSSLIGGRTAFLSQFEKLGTTSTSNLNDNYVSSAAFISIESSDGGTGTSPASAAKGGHFAGSWAVYARPAATNLLNICGGEINIFGESGASTRFQSGISIACAYAQRGTESDAAISISGIANAITHVGYGAGILFSSTNGAQPFASDSTIILAKAGPTNPSGIAPVVSRGIDFSQYNVTNELLKGAYTSVSESILTIGANSGTNAAVLSVGGPATNGSLYVRPRGSGAVQVQSPDGAVDWMLVAATITRIGANLFMIGGDVRWQSGAGSPEGAVAAVVGSIYSRTDGGAGTSFYVKESGTGNTGWAAK